MRIVILIVLLLASVGGYEMYMHFYPPAVMRHLTQQSLDVFSNAMSSKDRAKVAAALRDLLTDDAHVRLEIHFFTMNKNGGPGEAEEFSKPDFLNFIDNTLYSLDDYSFHSQLQDFTPGLRRTSAALSFLGTGEADGLSYYAGAAVAMRFSIEAVCEGNAVFENNHARLNNVNCKLLLHSLPKAGEEKKVKSPEALKELLR